jgi:hypothetical protein
MSYTKEPWFALLESQCAQLKRGKVAALLNVSAPTVSQVLNCSGKYGTGEASTDRLAEKVIHTFGRYACPHLSEQSGFGDEAVVITAEECRAYAHRDAPTGSPRAMQHWQACNACPHKAHTAPAQPREVKPRKKTNTDQQENP